MSERNPEVFIQWKGTDACLDLFCACGVTLHYDGDFANELTCGACGRVWELPHRLPLKDVTDSPDYPPKVLQPSDLPTGHGSYTVGDVPETGEWVRWTFGPLLKTAPPLSAKTVEIPTDAVASVLGGARPNEEVDGLGYGLFRKRVPESRCYTTASGLPVHVRPGCPHGRP